MKKITTLLYGIVLLVAMKDAYSFYSSFDDFIKNLNLENCSLCKENKLFGKDCVKAKKII